MPVACQRRWHSFAPPHSARPPPPPTPSCWPAACKRQRSRRRAARTQNEWFTQALRYHRGDGVPSNYTEALRLYQVAAANGSKPAQRMLERIYSRPAADGSVDIAWMQQLANLDVTREGAVLPTLSAPSPQLFVRDPTPLYDMIPPPWRAVQDGIRH